MKQEHIDTAIESYLELEARFASFLRAVPYNAGHLRVHSPLLASILLDACSLIESVFKASMDNARYNVIPGIANIRAKRANTNPPYLNIKDLRTVFRPDTYCAKPVWLLSLGVRSFPWYSWQTLNNQPSWWRGYNKVKHGRFENADKAKLGMVMHALKAAFLVLTQTLDFRKTLVLRGIIRSRGLTAAMLLPITLGWEQFDAQATVIATTKLFGYKFLTADGIGHAEDTSYFL